MTTPAPAGQSGYQTTTYTYDGAGNMINTSAPSPSNGGQAQVTVDTYTPDGQLATQTTGYGTAAASTTSYCYDPDGHQTSKVAPDGNVSGTAPCETTSPWTISPSAYPTQAAYQTISSYDSNGQLASTTRPATSAAPNGATTAYAYDQAGNLLTSTDPNGVTTTMTYNSGGLVTGISYSGSSAPSVSYTYDAQGIVTGMTDGSGSSSYAQDPFGELTSATNGAGQTTGYAYDADGDTTGITYPLPSAATWAPSHAIGYGYDKNDKLASVTDFNGNQIAISNNSDSLAAGETLSSTGDTVSYTYDQSDNPSAITLNNSSSTLQSFTYADAPDGEILTETDTPSSSQSPAGYAYDGQGRVTSMTPGTGSALNYGYDASGNLATLPTGAAGTYDHAGELASGSLSGTTTNFTYNADGARIAAQQGSTTIASGTWNGTGELTAYSNSAANMSAASYDGNGLRASDTVTPAGGSASTQQFVWDALADKLLMDSGNAYIYGNGTAPAEQVNLSTGAVTYLMGDALGSVRGLVNPTGSLTATTSYDAWGNPQTPGGLTSYTPFGFAGGYTDPTGLLYLIHRYYDPVTGQFISVDPDIADTSEPYAYANDDPVSKADPLGAWAVAAACGHCSFANEYSFQKVLVVLMVSLGIAVGGVKVTDQPRTKMLTPSGKIRYPDIYWQQHTFFGWLNELKIGSQGGTGGLNGKQAAEDREML
jgi:RHS repeat-associated protein